MRPNVYVTNHIHSQVIGKAFATGCGGKMVPPLRLLEGPAVVYGFLRGCGEIIKQCSWVGRDYYHIDHGYFKRGHYDGYYRVTRNGMQATELADHPDDRWRALDVPLRPWRRTGKHVVVAPISPALGAFLHIDPDKWTESVVSEISLHTDRPIMVKQKDGTSLFDVLEGAWCLVTHVSNAAVDALISGVPAVVLGHSAALPVAWSMHDIERPWWPDRDPWAHALAYHQFTLDEMRDGTAWRLLNGP